MIASIDYIFPRLIEFPKEWIRNYYEIKIRSTLECGTAFEFGLKLITPAIRQLIVYSCHYIDQACADASLTGLPSTLGHFSDLKMEGAHKRAKKEIFFSGERAGKTEKEDYQRRVIIQQFLNEWFRGESAENKHVRANINIKLNFEIESSSSRAKVSNTYKSSEHFNYNVVTVHLAFGMRKICHIYFYILHGKYTQR